MRRREAGCFRLELEAHSEAGAGRRRVLQWLAKVRIWNLKSDLRALLPMIPHYVKPISYDSSKLERLIGKVETTRYDRGIPATLDGLAQGRV